ncbi:hypothetical protein DLM75_22825 [Leptospira stimsonii]|uniref:Uncharacterized protein n=1 Tax=Leptospira stimsonii TaxID=2202203 RepID=A0A396YME4_9LEPT|nr:hypothetical protein DLM75_22825 [Leptospira stimsonii]
MIPNEILLRIHVFSSPNRNRFSKRILRDSLDEMQRNKSWQCAASKIHRIGFELESVRMENGLNKKIRSKVGTTVIGLKTRTKPENHIQTFVYFNFFIGLTRMDLLVSNLQ